MIKYQNIIQNYRRMNEAQFMDWIDEHQKTDETQFIALIDQHQPIIGKICRLYKDPKEDRENLFREIVFQLWKSASTCNDRIKFNCWIYQVALSTAIASNTLNKPKRFAEKIKRLTHNDPKDQLIDALKQLTDDDKAIIMLFLEDLTYPGIAEITGIAETIVGVKLNRIKKKVQQLINVPPKEQYPIKSIWRNIETSQKNEAELRSMISARPSPVFEILNNILPHPLSKSLATNGDLKRSLEDQLAKIKSYAILSISSRVIAAGCLLLLARFALTNSQAMRWIIAVILLIFITHIVLLSITWVKRARQMKYTIDHLRFQREYKKQVFSS